MDEKPTAGLMTAIIIAPLVALCCLGPLFIGSAMGSIVGWLSGQGLALTTALAVLAGALGYAVMRSRRTSSRREDGSLTCACVESKEWQGGEPDLVERAGERRDADHNAPGNPPRTGRTGHTTWRSVEHARSDCKMRRAAEDKRR